MKRLLLKTVLTTCFLLNCGTAALADPTELFETAVAFMQDAKTADCYIDAYESYKSARVNIERILEEYDKSETAEGLIASQKRIAGFTLEEFRGLEPILQFRSEAELNPLTTALLVADRTIEVGSEDNLKFYISGLLSENGFFEEALDIATSIGHINPSSDVNAFVRIARNLFMAGQKDKASEVFNRALEMAIQSNKDGMWKRRDLRTIIVNSSLSGGPGDVIDLLEKVLPVVYEMEDKEPHWDFRDSLFPGIVDAYLDIGEITRAEEICQQIISDENRLPAIVEIAKAYARYGEKEEAIAKLKNIRDVAEKKAYKYRKADVLVSAAIGYAAIDQFAEALQVVEEIDQQFKKDKALAGISVEYLRKDLITEAVKTAKMISQPGSKYEALLNIAVDLIDDGQYEEAFYCFGVAATAVNYTFSGYVESRMAKKCIDSLIKNGKLESAQTVRNKILLKEDEGWKDGFLVQFASSYAQIGEIDLALKTAELIRSEDEKVKSWSAIAVGYKNTGKAELALQLLDAARGAAQEAEYEYPRAWALTEVSRGYLKIGDFPRAIESAGMIEVLAEKSRILAEIAVDYLKEERNLNELEKAQLQKLLQDLLPLRRHLTSPDEVCEKIDFLMRVKMKKAASYGEFSDLYTDVHRELRFLSREYQWVESAPWSYFIGSDKEIIKGFSIEDINDLWSDLNPMYEAEQDPFSCALFVARMITDEEERNKALASIVMRMARAKYFSEARKAGMLISDIRRSSSSLMSVAVLVAEEGEFSEAIEIAGEIPDPGRKSEALVKIAESHAKRGQQGESSELLDQAMILAKSVEASSALEMIAYRYVELSDFKTALDTAQSIKNEVIKGHVLLRILEKILSEQMTGQEKLIVTDILESMKSSENYACVTVFPNTLAEIAERYHDAGINELSGILLDIAYGLAVKGKDNWSTPKSLVRIACAYLKAGNFREARRIVNEDLEKIPLIFLDYWKDQARSDFAIVHAKEMQYGEAYNALGTVEDGRIKTETIKKLAGVFTENREIDQLMAVTEEAGKLINNSYRSEASFALSSTWYKIGNRYWGEKCLSAGLNALSIIEVPHEKVERLIELADLYFETGKRREAVQSLSDAFEEVAKVQSDWIRSRLKERIGAKYLGEEQVEVAEQIADSIKTYQFRYSLLTRISKYYRNEGVRDRALEVSEKIDSEFEKNIVVEGIVEDYVKAQQYYEAIKLVEETKDEMGYDFRIFRLGNLLSEAGELWEALRVVSLIEDISLKSLALADIAIEYKKSNQKPSGEDRSLLLKLVQDIYPVERFWEQSINK